MSFTDILFKPNGRISKVQFWQGWGALVVANIVSNFIPFLNILFYFGLIYVGCCVYGKRLHDMGRSAWLLAIPWGIGFVLGIIGFILSMPAIMEVAQDDPQVLEDTAVALEVLQPFFNLVGIGFLVWLALTVWVGTAKPEPGANKFGPGPGGEPSADVFV